MTQPNTKFEEIGLQLADLIRGMNADRQAEEAAWDAAISAAKRREEAAEEVRWKLAIARAHRREAAVAAIPQTPTTLAEKWARDALGHHRVLSTAVFPRDHKLHVWLRRGLRATFADLDELKAALGTSAIDLRAVHGGHREESWNPYRNEVVALEIRHLAPGLFHEVG